LRIKDALATAITTLSEADITDPARDARWLLADLLNIDAAALIAHDDKPLSDAELSAFHARIESRSSGKPVSKITGQRAFFGLTFKVTEDTLDPRPETEHLVEHGIAHLRDQTAPHILDLGTGTGCILLSLLHNLPHAHGVGTDISEAALEVATQNASDLQIDRAQFISADWWPKEGRFDLIISNPPYIADSEIATLSKEVRDWDPHIALTPGKDGLTPYRIIAAGVQDRAKPGAALILEIGHQQARDVAKILAEAALTEITVFQDLAGKDRVITATI